MGIVNVLAASCVHVCVSLITVSAVLAVSVVSSVSAVESDPTVGWRADGTGNFAVQAAPTQWSQTEHIVWKTELSSWSNTSPVLIGDSIFTCAEPSTLLCINKKNGEVLWQQANEITDVVDGKTAAAIAAMTPIFQKIHAVSKKINSLKRKLRKDRENKNLQDKMSTALAEKKQLEVSLPDPELARKYAPAKTHKDNGFCSYIPVTDGSHVYAAFGNGVVAAYDMKGKRLWAHVESVPAHHWGGSTSPVIAGSAVIVGFNDYVAFDRKTGKELWRLQEKRQSFGSPIASNIGDTAVLITPQGDLVNAVTGVVIEKSLFKSTPYNAVIVDKGIVYVVGGGEKECAAIRLPQSIGGECEVLWKIEVKKNRYYGSPVLSEGLLYVVERSGFLTVLEAATGKKLSEQAIPGLKRDVYGSPTIAAGHIYISNDKGKIAVLTVGSNPVLLHLIDFEKNRCNPFFENGFMYFKGEKNIYCVK